MVAGTVEVLENVSVLWPSVIVTVDASVTVLREVEGGGVIVV